MSSSNPFIIRLQNLPLEARSIDIRRFFDGLCIPDGGVHIIGGELGVAFIAFQSDEDARQALLRDGNLICNSKVKLYLSSKTEMQTVISVARNQIDLKHQTQAPVINKVPDLLKNPSTLDLLNSITKLISSSSNKPAPEEPPIKKQIEAPKPNISINDILNIIKNTNPSPTSSEQINIPPTAPVKKPALLPTPSEPPLNLAEQKKTFKRKFEETNQPCPGRVQLDPIIRVKNFPSNSSYKDIRTFLQGVQIEHNGIKFILEHKGQAFVRLVSIIDLKRALCRNGQFYEQNQIEVIQSSEQEFQNGPQENVQEATENFYIKIYGLPAKFDEFSLKQMFNNVKFVRIITATVTPFQHRFTNQDGSTETKTILKAKKLCQVETQLDVDRALTRQDERVGKNKIQIFQISKAEFEREIDSIKPSNQGQYQNQEQWFAHSNENEQEEQYMGYQNQYNSNFNNNNNNNNFNNYKKRSQNSQNFNNNRKNFKFNERY